MHIKNNLVISYFAFANSRITIIFVKLTQNPSTAQEEIKKKPREIESLQEVIVTTGGFQVSSLTFLKDPGFFMKDASNFCL